jgi:hypothetical protein
MVDIPLEAALDFVQQSIFESSGRYLSDLEVIIFKEAWANLTYAAMAKKYGYSPEYFNNDVGFNLWKKLSESLSAKVGRRSFKEVIRLKMSESRSSISVPQVEVQSVDKGAIAPESFPFPEGSEPLDSPFYIKRDSIEELCQHTVVKPGSLIRIKASKLMGKSSLINWIIGCGIHQNYQTVRLDFESVDRQFLQNIDQLLRWLCSMICRQLKITPCLEEYWHPELLGNNDNCTCYFEDYLLPSIDNTLVLVLDNVDRIFPYADVIEDFFGMLRSWHEKGKTAEVWQRVRLVIAHSTEAYIPLDFNQSPFNAGVPLELKDFSPQQVLNLAQLHHLNWEQTHLEQLMNLVGGHPYLVRLALYQIASGHITLTDFLAQVVTESGIYSPLLRRYLSTLRADPPLSTAYQKVVHSSEPIALDSMQIFRLHSLGLIHANNNEVMPRCNLYRQYFARVLAA